MTVSPSAPSAGKLNSPERSSTVCSSSKNDVLYALLDVLDRNECNTVLMDRVIRFTLRSGSSPFRSISPKLVACQRDALVFYIAGIFGMMLGWHVRGYDRTVEEMSDTLMFLLSTPLYPQPKP